MLIILLLMMMSSASYTIGIPTMKDLVTPLLNPGQCTADIFSHSATSWEQAAVPISESRENLEESPRRVYSCLTEEFKASVHETATEETEPASWHCEWNGPISPDNKLKRYCSLAKEVLKASRNDEIIRLGHHIGASVTSTDTERWFWDNNVLQIDADTTRALIEETIDALNTDTLTRKERCWGLGLLLSLQETLSKPEDLGKCIPSFRHQNGLSRGELELSLIGGRYSIHPSAWFTHDLILT